MVNVVEIVIEAVNKTKEGFAAAEEDSGTFATKMQAVGLVGAAALGGVAIASLDMASKFDSSMTMLQTQAGVSKQTMQQLQTGVLNLAGQVGFSPDSLAEAAYHVASNMSSMGATSTQMLSAVKVAAEGAATGHADLVDVTNALGAAIASGMKGTQNYTQAMGVLNATVGAGDMKMQDLANAFGSGLLATVKGFGVSITDVGAALAVFGDNNIRGAQAGTELRMAIQSLASPAKAGADTLAKIGLSTTQLATDMQHGGLNAAITDLRNHMIAAGDTGDKVGTVLTDAFGKKAGAGINILVDQYGRLQSKYPELEKGANNFGQAWATTQQTLSQKMKDVEGNFEALAIELGNKLMPAAQAVFGFLAGHAALVSNLAIAILAVVGALAAYAIVAKTVAIAQAVLDAVMDMNPFVAIGIAVVAIAAVIIKYHTQIWNFIVQTWDKILNFLKQWWPLVLGIFTGGLGLLIGGIIKYHTQIWAYIVEIWTDISNFFISIWNQIYNDTIGAVIRTFDAIESVITSGFDGWWKSHGQELEDVWKAVWTAISTIFKVYWDIVSTVAKVAWDAFSTVAKVEWEILQVIWEAVWTAISTAFKVYWTLLSAEASIAWTALTTLFKVTWDLITGIFSVALAVIEAVAKNAWDVIAAVVKVAWAAIQAVLKSVWDVIVGLFNVFLDLVTGHWSQAWKDVQTAAQQVWNNIKGFLSTTWNAISTLASQVFNNMKNMMAGVWNAIKSTATSLWDALKSGFDGVVGGIETAWDRLEGIFKTPVNFLINTVYDGGIARLWNDVMGAIGGPKMPTIQGLATGGKLGGFGGGDRNLALLEDGEAVVDKDRTRKYAPLLKAMGVPGFSGGGVMGGILSGIESVGGDIWGGITDVASIGAALLTGNTTALGNDMKKFVGTDATGQLATMMLDIPTKIISQALSKAASFGKSLLGSGGGVSGSVASYKGVVDQALKLLGLPLTDDSVVLTQMNTESGGNPLAVNNTDSNAAAGTPSTGLMQVIGPTFAAYAGPFAGTGPFLNGVSVNPLANIYAAINYAMHAYGSSWTSVLGQGHGYASGGATAAGWAMLGEQGRELVKLPGGAHVYPAGQTAGMVAGGQGGAQVVHLVISGGGQSEYDALMLKWLREKARTEGGGNVQTAFGKH